MASSHNVEMEAAKFLHKLIQESKDEPAKLATKLFVILQHMKISGKEQSLPYQVISRAMEMVISQHGLDIAAVQSSRLPFGSGTQNQIGDSGQTTLKGKEAAGNSSPSDIMDMPPKGGLLVARNAALSKGKEDFGISIPRAGMLKDTKVAFFGNDIVYESPEVAPYEPPQVTDHEGVPLQPSEVFGHAVSPPIPSEVASFGIPPPGPQDMLNLQDVAAWMMDGESYPPLPTGVEFTLDDIFKDVPVIGVDTSADTVNEAMVADPMVEVQTVDAPGESTRVVPPVVSIQDGSGVSPKFSENSFSLTSEQMGNWQVNRLVDRLRYFLGVWRNGNPADFALDVAIVMQTLGDLAAEGVGVEALRQYIDRCLDIGRRCELEASCSLAERARSEVELATKALQKSHEAALAEQQSLIDECMSRSSTEHRAVEIRQELDTCLTEIQRLEATARLLRAESQAVDTFLSSDDHEGRNSSLVSVAERLKVLVTEQAVLEARASDEAYWEVKRAAMLQGLEAEARDLVQGALDVLPS